MNFPTNEDRTVIVGRTGSGKTVAGLFMLSEMDIDEQPWVIVDYKRDEKIARIPYATYIPVGFIPTLPGVYIVQPQVKVDDETIEDYLTAIWDHENIGLYIDEGVMLARSNALDVIYIQGRSKHIPVITLTQRPVGISRYAFSEAQYIWIYPNHDKRERKTIAEFTDLDANMDDYLLPRYHSYYFDVVGGKHETLKPVAPIERTFKTFERKLKPPEPTEVVPERKHRFVPL